MKSGFFDKLINRLDKLDAGSLQTQFLRLAGDKGLLETIFHAIQEGIIVLNDKGRVTYANRAAEKLFGFSLEAIVDQPIQRYLKDIDWDLVMDLDENEWSRLVSREIEISYPVHRFISFYLVPLSVVEEGENGAVVILRDITRDRVMEAHNLESERLQAITLLAAGVAHEIGNPLNSLTIHLQLITREIKSLASKEQANLSELVDIAQQEVHRLDQIIHQFLRAVRPQVPQLEFANLSDLIGETLTFMKYEIEDRGILVEVETPEQIPLLKIDKAQVKQAFFNGVKNAVQAMSTGGLLKVSVSVTNRFVCVSIQDTGPGIPAEELGNIFEPYHTTKAEGTGLGLMIVQRIMRDHGGEIEIDSTPNKGTQLSLYFMRKDQRIRLLKAPHSTQKKTKKTS
ncbi:MAG: PAS domain-containing protein [Kiritimatiellae bacterium]|nr:PAS domain-containing protein [Kiritimatiellia bacterium]